MNDESAFFPDWAKRIAAATVLVVIIAGVFWGMSTLAFMAIVVMVLCAGGIALTICVFLGLFAVLGGRRLDDLLERTGMLPFYATMVLGAGGALAFAVFNMSLLDSY